MIHKREGADVQVGS